MTIAQMSHFYALCQSGSYTQAAKQLYITQPALSKSIAALESEPQAGGAQHTDSGTDSGGGGVRTGV